jgi:hypothetical protein
MWSLVRKSRSKILRCSFCTKTQNDVRKLIAGPKVHICDECIDLCIDILSEDLRKKPQGCLLCGLTKEMREMTRIPGRGSVCGPCLKVVGAMFEHSKDQDHDPGQTT